MQLQRHERGIHAISAARHPYPRHVIDHSTAASRLSKAANLREYRDLDVVFVIRTSVPGCDLSALRKAAMNEAPQIPAGVDTSRPTPTRIYDYMLQGK